MPTASVLAFPRAYFAGLHWSFVTYAEELSTTILPCGPDWWRGSSSFRVVCLHRSEARWGERTASAEDEDSGNANRPSDPVAAITPLSAKSTRNGAPPYGSGDKSEIFSAKTRYREMSSRPFIEGTRMLLVSAQDRICLSGFGILLRPSHTAAPL
jgi:hypothetical protein